MGVKGALIGGCIGCVFGAAGAVVGAVLGDMIEKESRKRGISLARGAGRAFAAAGRRRPKPGGGRSSADPLSAAYSVLGVLPSASSGELRRAYRAMAKRFHPDVLRAAGASNDAISRATEAMERINAAWAAVRRARGL